MTFGPLEVLATLLIAFSVIKLAVVLISPQAWLNFAKKIYAKPQVTSAVGLVLAAIVLFILVSSGITIVEILAVTLFVVLLIVIGMARYGEEIIDWAQKQDVKAMLKESWLYTLIWVVLLGWGIAAIFFA